jgi:predicted RNA-binding protein (TIGR00451 family)
VFIVVESQQAGSWCSTLDDALNRIRSVANYQFGKSVGTKLFPKNVVLIYSKATRRIRYVYLDDKRLATLRPTDGLFSLSIAGAKRIGKNGQSAKCFVTVKADVSEFVAQGGDVFAAHVINVDDEVRPKDEVIIFNEEGEVLAVGRAVLSSREVKAFKTGVAVKVRRGCLEES